MTDDRGPATAIPAPGAGGDGTTTGLTEPTQTLQAEIDANITVAASNAERSDPAEGRGLNPSMVDRKINAIQDQIAAEVGQGFQFSPQDIDTQLAHCRDQLTDLRTDLLNAKRAQAAVHAPAQDNASGTQAQAVSFLLSSTVETINTDIAYLTNWQKLLNDAKARYLSNEHLTEEQWQRLAQGITA